MWKDKIEDNGDLSLSFITLGRGMFPATQLCLYPAGYPCPNVRTKNLLEMGWQLQSEAFSCPRLAERL